MTLGDELILCSGTLSEEAPLEVVAFAAADAGFHAVSMWGHDYGRAIKEGLSDTDIRSVLLDNGLSVAYLDPAWWWLPGASDFVIPPEADALNLFCYGEREMFALAETLEASSILAIDAFGGSWTMDEAVGAFGAFCDRAAEAGLAVHLEFLPWSRIPDLATAWEIVRLADRANGGIGIDAWHFFRGNPDLALLETLPGEKITAVILDDAPLIPEDDLINEATRRRLLPGHGVLNLNALLATLRGIGTDVPIGVEVLSDTFRDYSPAKAARLAAEATQAVLAEVVSP